MMIVATTSKSSQAYHIMSFRTIALVAATVSSYPSTILFRRSSMVAASTISSSYWSSFHGKSSLSSQHQHHHHHHHHRRPHHHYYFHHHHNKHVINDGCCESASHWKLQAIRGGDGNGGNNGSKHHKRSFFSFSSNTNTKKERTEPNVKTNNNTYNKNSNKQDTDTYERAMVVESIDEHEEEEEDSAISLNSSNLPSVSSASVSKQSSTKTNSYPWGKTIRQAVGNVISGTGFVTSSLVSLVTDRRSFQDRYVQPLRALQNYLKVSGVDLELTPQLNRRLGMNLCLLGRVHMHLAQQQQSRHKQPHDRKMDASFWVEARRYMRYATAVYGQAMIHAAEVDARGNFPSTSTFGTVTKSAISKHISVPPDDIVVMDVQYNGDTEYLRHMIVVDHQHQKVVLSIRGTFSLGEIVIDAAAFSREFCGGEAHSEMATMAERVWSKAGPTITTMLEQNDKYELIITGHSLGAGAACLLMILLETKPSLLPPHQTKRCFAYAPPPVYTPLEFVPQTVRSTTSFVHQNDMVPFLSVHTVRRLFRQIKAVDDVSHDQMTRRERYQVLLGMQPPPPALIASVVKATETVVTPKPGAPILSIPSETIVWLKKMTPQQQQQQEEEDKRFDGPEEDITDKGKGGVADYDFEMFRPNRLKQYDIQVHPDMLLDHFPPRYEHALDHLKTR
ncbi:lipase class 3 [Nitzschia inconspicua]|uniref:Lipase class 3 n=1 Tax=Nitzschia inconspicua TaxID=303405 RepID=A0A9K3PDF9_9STRA|nr:lipase class 3 [Nitzschia inconspicua]KAG7371697.1 lipase class 3 [Nitzschia inconspicua]